MVDMGCDEVMLEAELTNVGALALYEKLGFARDERLGRYYLNGGDAYRLKLWIDKYSPKGLEARIRREEEAARGGGGGAAEEEEAGEGGVV
jgi:peptide alpha-N-acetyltransferase